MPDSGPATGVIHDLGYRGYDGPRLGRAQIVRALTWHSFRSSFGIGKLWRLGTDAITSFSAAPLKAASVAGFVIAIAAIVYGGWLVGKTLVLGIDLPGYASTITLVLFLGGLQLLSLGVLGEYVARIYDEVKSRPLYVVRSRHGALPPSP